MKWHISFTSLFGRLALAGLLTIAAAGAARSAEPEVEKFDGVWMGTSEGTSCLGASVIEFVVSKGAYRGIWSMSGTGIAPAMVGKFSGVLDVGGGISLSLGQGSFFARVEGRLGENRGAGVLANPTQSFCHTFWDVTKVGAPPAGEPDVSSKLDGDGTKK